MRPLGAGWRAPIIAARRYWQEGRRKLPDSCTGPGVGFHRFHRPTIRVGGQGLPSWSRLVSPMRDESAPNTGGRILAPTDGFQPIRAPTESGPSTPRNPWRPSRRLPRATSPGFWGRCNVKGFEIDRSQSEPPLADRLWGAIRRLGAFTYPGWCQQTTSPLPSALYRAGSRASSTFGERAL